VKVFILRGLPGCGKTTWIEKQIRHLSDAEQITVCSADHFHMRDGKYQFDARNIGPAHNVCLDKFLRACEHSVACIYVDNTNISAWEIAPYYRFAECYTSVREVEVRIVQINCTLECALRNNIHNVPSSTIWEMQRRLLTEQLPPHWKLDVLPGWEFPQLPEVRGHAAQS
jgi:hypothetical protein